MIKEFSSSDGTLVRLAQAGDMDAYNMLLERYQHKVKQMICFYVDDKANVNDLVQEVLLKVYRYLPSFKEECEFSTWMHRIIQNTVKNYFRDTSIRNDTEARFANEQEVSTCFSPEYNLINMELGNIVDSAIDQLSEDLRLCYGLHVFEGQTYEDIAQRMHCPIGTVRSRIFRVRKLVMGMVNDTPK